MRVLIVEDSAPTRELLTRALGEFGMTIVTATRLSTGIDQALGGDFDVIVLDLMLPDGDGLELCREIPFSMASSSASAIAVRTPPRTRPIAA